MPPNRLTNFENDYLNYSADFLLQSKEDPVINIKYYVYDNLNCKTLLSYSSAIFRPLFLTYASVEVSGRCAHHWAPQPLHEVVYLRIRRPLQAKQTLVHT